MTAGDSPIATLLTLGLLLVAAQAPELLGLTTGGLSLGSVLQVAWLARGFGGPAGVAAGRLAAATTRAAPATGWAPRPLPRPATVSGAAGGTGAGFAASGKAGGFGRGGRRSATDTAGGGPGGGQA
jgi:hypothetical protein